MTTKYFYIIPLIAISLSCSAKKTETKAKVNPDTESIFDSATNPDEKELTNDLIWYSGEFYGKSVRGVSSMNDGEHFTAMDNGEMGPEINKYSYKTYEKVSTILTFMDLKDEDGKPIPIDAYEFSADEQKVLIAYRNAVNY